MSCRVFVKIFQIKSIWKSKKYETIHKQNNSLISYQNLTINKLKIMTGLIITIKYKRFY